MSVIKKIFKNLDNNKSELGVSVATLASRAKTSRDNVYRRIYDLRTEGLRITSNVVMNKGKRKTYYRIG